MIGVFDIVRPGSVEEASALLAERGPDAALYAGGTELLILMKDRLLEPALLVDLKAIPGLDGIAMDPGGRALRIGALARHRAIETSPLVREALPELAAVESQVANVRVRHAGTLGGNLCFAEPHSDPATLLVALDATFELASGAGRREVAAGEFFTGFLSTARGAEEIMTAVNVPLPAAGTRVVYERFKTHERPSASAAVAIGMDGGAVSSARVVVGCVGETPLRIAGAEALLLGQALDADLIDAAAERAREEAEPTEDPFESDGYKRHLAATLVRRALERAAMGGMA